MSDSNEPLENLVEAALYFKGGTMTTKELSNALRTSREETLEAVKSLKSSLEGRGLTLVLEGDHVALATSPAAHELIEKMRREELEGPLGKAGLETLAVVVFRGPVSRTDVEYVRGVNCTSILRTLLIRGLVERIDNPTDRRSYLYRATTDLPAYLGVGELTEIPGYADMRTELDSVVASREAEEKPSEPIAE